MEIGGDTTKVTAYQYDALQREIIETEQNLENLEQQAEDNNWSLSGFTQAADKIGKQLYVSKLLIEKREISLKNMVSKEGIQYRMNRSIQVEGHLEC